MSYQFKINSLSFAFKKDSPYLFKNISLTLESGKIYLVTGANGSGKSTFFRILQGQTKQNEKIEGAITVNEETINLATMTSELSQKIALVQQNYNAMLVLEFTGEENLRLATLPSHPMFSQLPNYFVSKELLNKFEIPLHIPVKLLSGGQRQLLAILTKLQKPIRVLLLDEPTAALDSKNTKIIINMLKQLAIEKDIIIIAICHDTEVINNHDKNTILHVSKDGDTSVVNFISNDVNQC